MSTKKKIITVIIGVEAVIIAAVIVFLFYINSDTVKVNRQLELAQKYLLEEDYVQAIAVFEGIIEIDPKNEEAYLGMAEAYAKIDDLENAVKILEKASKRVDSEEVLAMLETHTAEIEQRQQAAQRAAEAAAQATTDAAASSEQTDAEASPQDMDAAETQTPETEMVLTGFIVQDGELYYYDETGNYVTGWFDKNDNRYCARDDGRLYKDGEHEIDSTKYLFDQGGVCLGEVEEEEWKQAYINYIQQEHKKWIQVQDPQDDIYKERYQLIYINNDSIPELIFLSTESDPNFVYYRIVTYANETIFESITGRSISYIEHGNLVCISDWNMGMGSSDSLYNIKDGKLAEVASFDIGIDPSGEEHYGVNGSEVSEAEYEQEWERAYGGNKQIIEGDEWMSWVDADYNQILNMINGF